MFSGISCNNFLTFRGFWTSRKLGIPTISFNFFRCGQSVRGAISLIVQLRCRLDWASSFSCGAGWTGVSICDYATIYCVLLIGTPYIGLSCKI
ncbi:MAG: hypothetical protein DMG97_29590 [Acidobacteria bacterium]|nr:MAG: hypothetical protein DMG97_29590 [Acidobacteriota bacterium]